jgi:CRP/FNR family transcriptional regulator, anaerobic regulatory protein
MHALNDVVRAGPVMGSNTTLFREGDRFTSLFAVRSGFVKTSTLGPDGSEQVLGFHLPGDILGFDAIHSGHYHATATVLGSTSVCAVPFDDLSELASQDPALQRRMFSLLSRDINSYFSRLGDARADQRLAGFLLELSQRFADRGFSPRTFVLAMSRRDIGNYLRLATETVSRVLTRFQSDGLIRVTRREVELLDPDGLRALASA